MVYYISLCYVCCTVGPEWVGLKGRGLSQGVLTVKVECESTGSEKKSSKHNFVYKSMTSHHLKGISHLYIISLNILAIIYYITSHFLYL